MKTRGFCEPVAHSSVVRSGGSVQQRPCELAISRFHLVWISIDEPELDPYQSAPLSLFDDWQVLPVFARLGQGGGSASPAVVWHLCPCLHPGLAIAPFAIGCHGRWLPIRGMALDLSHQLSRRRLFGLGYGTSHPQTAVQANGGSTPKRASLLFFLPPPFSPLWPT